MRLFHIHKGAMILVEKANANGSFSHGLCVLMLKRILRALSDGFLRTMNTPDNGIGYLTRKCRFAFLGTWYVLRFPPGVVREDEYIVTAFPFYVEYVFNCRQQN